MKQVLSQLAARQRRQALTVPQAGRASASSSTSRKVTGMASFAAPDSALDQRAMPFGNARSLSPDETYAVAAYVLSLNDIVKDPDFELNDRNLATIRMPNETAFRDDDRDTAEKSFWNPSPCMTDCKPEVRIVGRAAVLAVTPDRKAAPKVE